MERLKKQLYDMPLRRALVCSVAVTVALVLTAGGLTIWLGTAFMRWLLPNEEDFYLNVAVCCRDHTETDFVVRLSPGDDILNFVAEANDFTEQIKLSEIERMVISLDRFANSVESLSPKRRLAYRGTEAAIVILPFLYFVAGIVGCAFWFYRRRLEEPIRRLTEATEQIRRQDLDFTMEELRPDELGQLGASFERMRAALVQNNRQIWDMLKARKELQASVAHDLRNPIAIICGYTEYVQIRLEAGALGEDEITRIASNLEHAAGRLERYTDSLREIGQLEETEVRREACVLEDELKRMEEDFILLVRQAGLCLAVPQRRPGRIVRLDASLLHRVLENLVQNSLRFARKEIRLSYVLEGDFLVITVTDDGAGFPADILRRQKGAMLPDGGEHMGMGLAVCQVLCQKQGGTLSLCNAPEGGAAAMVRVFIS